MQHTGISEVPASTLELLVLKTLALGGPMPVYGIGQFIQATSEDVLQIETQALYRMLQKMVGNKMLSAELEPGSERVRCYQITAAGQQRLRRAALDFRRTCEAVNRLLSIG